MRALQGPSSAFRAPTICLGHPSVPEEKGVSPGHARSRRQAGLGTPGSLILSREANSAPSPTQGGHRAASRLPGSLSAAPRELWRPLGPPAPPALPPWSCWAVRGPQDSADPSPSWVFGLLPCAPRTEAPNVTTRRRGCGALSDTHPVLTMLLSALQGQPGTRGPQGSPTVVSGLVPQSQTADPWPCLPVSCRDCSGDLTSQVAPGWSSMVLLLPISAPASVPSSSSADETPWSLMWLVNSSSFLLRAASSTSASVGSSPPGC